MKQKIRTFVAVEIDPAVRTHMLERLAFLYGRERAETAMPEV